RNQDHPVAVPAYPLAERADGRLRPAAPAGAAGAPALRAGVRFRLRGSYFTAAARHLRRRRARKRQSPASDLAPRRHPRSAARPHPAAEHVEADRGGAQRTGHSAAGLTLEDEDGFLCSAAVGSLPACETTSRLATRQISEPTSSITMNIAGTNTSESTVEKIRPPITASAIGERNSPPAPTASALGVMPATIAIVVITIGRARFMPASTIASSRGLPARSASIANSTSMIAFLVTMPISIRMPIHTGVVSCLPVIRSAAIAPPIESGSENRMVIGCRKVPN